MLKAARNIASSGVQKTGRRNARMTSRLNVPSTIHATYSATSTTMVEVTIKPGAPDCVLSTSEPSFLWTGKRSVATTATMSRRERSSTRMSATRITMPKTAAIPRNSVKNAEPMTGVKTVVVTTRSAPSRAAA